MISITLGDKHFKTKTEAKKFFSNIRERIEKSGDKITQGQKFDLLHELHRIYFEPEEWNNKLPGKRVLGFIAKMTPHEVSTPSRHVQTLSFFAVFDNDTTYKFSADKAIDYIAKTKQKE